MGTHQTPQQNMPSMKKRLVAIGAFSVAYSVTAASLANLYIWQKEFCNRFVHYSTKTVETVDGIHPVVVATIPGRTWLRKPVKELEFALRNADDWRRLRGYIAQDIRYIAQEPGTLAQTEAVIQKIERQGKPESHQVIDTGRPAPVRARA
jgi:hypothetical protein